MKDQKVWYTKLWGNKAVELESYKRDNNGGDRIKKWDLEFTRKERISHAGFEISLETPEKTYNFNFYDTRHWDKEEERWIEPVEEWERYFRQRAEEESLEKALERMNNWIERKRMVYYLEDRYNTNDIRDIVEDVPESSRLDVALDLFYVLFQRRMRNDS